MHFYFGSWLNCQGYCYCMIMKNMEVCGGTVIIVDRGLEVDYWQCAGLCARCVPSVFAVL